MEKQPPPIEQIPLKDWKRTPKRVRCLLESLWERVKQDEAFEEDGQVETALRETEEQLKEQQAQIDLVVQASNVGFYLSDLRTNTSFVSPAYKAQLGYGPEDPEASPADWNERLHPEDRERAMTAYRAFKQQQAPYNIDFRLRHRDGSYRWIYSNAHLICDATGNPIKIVGTHIDITDRKQVETTLQQQFQREQALNRVFQAIRNSLNLETIFATATAETAQLLHTLDCAVVQYFPEQGVWKPVAEFRHDPTSPTTLGLEIPDQGNPFATRLKRFQVVKVEDTDRVQDHVNQEIAQVLPGAWLLVPLLIEGNLWGSFTISTQQHPFSWTDEQVELAQAVADQLEVAIQQANLYQQAQLELSERCRAEAALLESEKRYRLLAENINDLVCLHELDGRYLYVSPSCESLLGYRYNEMIGQDPYSFFHPDDRQRIQEEAPALAMLGKATPITYRMRHKSGAYVWFETLIKPILNDAGQVIQLQTTSREVTERIQVQERLRYDALHDALTGLPNRNLLMERLELAIHRAIRSESYHFAVLFLDLDRFKVINDSLGHLAGDQLLIAVAQKLQSILRATDLAVRLGGDEFVLLLEEIRGVQEAVRVTERIFSELGAPLTIEGREVYIATSIGIVFGSKEYEQASHLLRDADIAMYRAKSQGKGRYEIFNAEMHTQALNRLHLENDLRQAIERQEFILHYQPIVALKGGQLVGFEALIRWQHPTQGLKSPAEFIPVAEETGLISYLDYWALEIACHQLTQWQTTFPELHPLKVSVNLSVQDFWQPGLLEAVDHIVAQTQVNGFDLTLEITESMLLEDTEATIDILERLKQRCIQISIDDFGTGYSSLNYLHRLPVDSLKVDRSFVHQIQEDGRKHQIVETIAALSNQLGMVAIAEGIETQQQLERLQQLGYAFGQGYLFSKPLSSEAATALLRKSQTQQKSSH